MSKPNIGSKIKLLSLLHKIHQPARAIGHDPIDVLAVEVEGLLKLVFLIEDPYDHSHPAGPYVSEKGPTVLYHGDYTDC
jgi:hypothetical protein